MAELGIVLYFKHSTIQLDHISLPMRDIFKLQEKSKIDKAWAVNNSMKFNYEYLVPDPSFATEVVLQGGVSNGAKPGDKTKYARANGCEMSVQLTVRESAREAFSCRRKALSHHRRRSPDGAHKSWIKRWEFISRGLAALWLLGICRTVHPPTQADTIHSDGSHVRLDLPLPPCCWMCVPRPFPRLIVSLSSSTTHLPPCQSNLLLHPTVKPASPASMASSLPARLLSSARALLPLLLRVLVSPPGDSPRREHTTAAGGYGATPGEGRRPSRHRDVTFGSRGSRDLSNGAVSWVPPSAAASSIDLLAFECSRSRGAVSDGRGRPVGASGGCVGGSRDLRRQHRHLSGFKVMNVAFVRSYGRRRGWRQSDLTSFVSPKGSPRCVLPSPFCRR
eukprot:scaffold50352_cov40-Cyclotella_meneghiniana.AAC.6